MPSGPIGLDRDRDRTPALELERAKRDRAKERARLEAKRAAQIERIQSSEHWRPKTKRAMVAKLQALWAERDRLLAEQPIPHFEYVCTVCGKPYTTPRNARYYNRVLRCAPCQREVRLEQKRVARRKAMPAYRAKTKADGRYQQWRRNYRRRKMYGKITDEVEQRRQRRAFTIQFGLVLPPNLLVQPLLIAGGGHAPSPTVPPRETVMPMPRLKRTDGAGPSERTNGRSQSRSGAVVWSSDEDEP